MNRAGFAIVLAFLVMGVADAMGPLSDAVEKQYAITSVTATMLPFFVFIAFAVFSVPGGGLAGAAPLFMPRLIEEMNGTIAKYQGERLPRLAQRVFDLDDKSQREQFLRGETREITVPRSQRKIAYDPLKRIGVGVSELGANQAIGIGAYAYALQQLDR